MESETKETIKKLFFLYYCFFLFLFKNFLNCPLVPLRASPLLRMAPLHWEGDCCVSCQAPPLQLSTGELRKHRPGQVLFLSWFLSQMLYAFSQQYLLFANPLLWFYIYVPNLKNFHTVTFEGQKEGKLNKYLTLPLVSVNVTVIFLKKWGWKISNRNIA